MNVLACKRQLRHRFNDHVGTAGGGVANRHARRQQGEINELASVDWEILNLLFVNDGTDHGACWLGNFANVLNGDFFFDLPDGKIEIEIP